MARIPDDLLYSEEHEYVRRSDAENVVVVGITDYAQGELGDVVYVDLPKVGTAYGRMDVFGTIEAVKAVSELFAPISGAVIEVNTALDKRSEEHTSELQSQSNIVCRLLLEKKKKKQNR